MTSLVAEVHYLNDDMKISSYVRTYVTMCVGMCMAIAIQTSENEE